MPIHIQPIQTANIANHIKQLTSGNRSPHNDSIGTPHDKSKINSNQVYRSELKKACMEFESLFVGHLLKEMRSTVPESGFFGGGKAEKIYTSMLDEKFAREIALNGGIGLATQLYNQFSEGLEDTPDNDVKN